MSICLASTCTCNHGEGGSVRGKQDLEMLVTLMESPTPSPWVVLRIQEVCAMHMDPSTCTKPKAM